MQGILNAMPVVSGKFDVIDDQITLCNSEGDEFELSGFCGELRDLKEVISKLDGSKTVGDAISGTQIEQNLIESVLVALRDVGMASKLEVREEYVSGLNCLLELEDLQNKLMYESLYQNIFWKSCQDADSVPQNVFYGMAIENYHFLFRESWFDSPILGLASSIKARVLMNEFFCEEYGHDELILKSLNNIGISREQIYKTVPLPETLGLCNALAYWSANDPLFFFSTMGVLEGKDLKIDTYVSAMESSSKISDDFVRYIRDHSNINLNEQHGNLSREIFRKIPVIARSDVERMKRQTHLFIEIYDRFYTAIWNHYSKNNDLLRLV